MRMNGIEEQMKRLDAIMPKREPSPWRNRFAAVFALVVLATGAMLTFGVAVVAFRFCRWSLGWGF